MPVKLSATITKIELLSNSVNSSLISELCEYMKKYGLSESHINNTLKTNMLFSEFLGAGVSFYDVKRNEQIINFLDSKMKSTELDPDRKWITTWNDYLGDIKYFFRWLYNYKLIKQDEIRPVSEWETPSFAIIKKKKTKRVSPYLESEIWDRGELELIIKYEKFKRNKAAISMMWDLDARNHEITLLKIKHIRLKERYGEGEIPHQAKTGSGPFLLTFSFPYVRDWLNEHPFKNEPNARLFCNLYNGGQIRPDALWSMMKNLKKRISRLIETDAIMNKEEKQMIMNEFSKQNSTIDENMSKTAMSKETKPLMGNFVDAGDGFYKAEGVAKVINLADGKTFLRLENLKATNGPDLYVYLSTDKGVSDFVNLGRLKGNIGNQNYEIPAGTDLAKYDTVLIWCKAFSTLFGSAKLSGQ